MDSPHPFVSSSPGRGRFRRTVGGALLLATIAMLLWFQRSDKSTARSESDDGSGLSDPAAVAPPPSAAALRPQFAAALGIDGDALPGERLYLLRGIDDALSPHETKAALVELLALPDAATAPGWHAEYIHEICRLLRRGGVGNTQGVAFVEALATLAGDSERPLVIRDYALQHLATFWSDPAATGIRPKISTAIQRLISTGPPVSAPALLALHRLGDASSQIATRSIAAQGFPDQLIEPLAVQVLNSSTDTATRMAAVRIVADRKFSNLREELRKIAADAGEPTVLRMAAAAAIARFTDPEDALFIAAIPAPEGSPLAGALRHAASAIAAAGD